VVIAFDPEIDDFHLLSLVYQLVKLNTLSSTGELDEINVAEVNRSLGEAAKALEPLNAISKSASAIRNAAASIIKDIDSLRESVSQHLRAAQTAISKGLSTEIMLPADQISIEEAEPFGALGEATD
jgi:hypothetical protein